MERNTSRHESAAADAHLIDMGRDEMNLAEFPLATLADRAPSGAKTLVFEDRIWDRGQRQDRIRRLTITASDKYGLPTATDDEVILGLVQVTKATGFAERQVRFSRYQLIGLLGWRDEGRSYQRLETSLKRWLGVTLYRTFRTTHLQFRAILRRGSSGSPAVVLGRQLKQREELALER